MLSSIEKSRVSDASVARRIRFNPQVLIGTLMISCAFVEYSSMWFWPNIRTDILFSGLQNVGEMLVRIGGAQFRLFVWVVFILGFALFLFTRRPYPVAVAIAPFCPFLLSTTISAVTGEIPGTSVWYLAQWTIMATAASVAAQLCNSDSVYRAGARIIAGCALGSLLLGVIAPSYAVSSYSGQMLLRGLFASKNAAGWFACIGFIWMFGFRRRPFNYISYAIMTALIMMLLWTGTKAALAVLVGVTAFLLFVSAMQRIEMHWMAKSLVTVLVLIITAAVILLALPALIELLGKDPTLTGRTSIWDTYLRFMEDNFWLGRGPGSFAFASEINQRIAETMDERQRVYGVHNMYLAMFGDTGILGVSLYVLALAYVALVPLYRHPSPGNTAAAAFSFAILIVGFSEAIEHIVPGAATFMLLTTRSEALKRRSSLLVKKQAFQPERAQAALQRRTA